MSAQSKPTILVVDSSQLVRELVRDSFLEADMCVTTARDGREGLERVHDQRPSVIVTEIVLPELDGWGLCEALKEDLHTRDIPLIFLSSENEVSQRCRALRMGAYDVLAKPFSPEELVLRVQIVLDRLGSGSAWGEGPRNFLSGHTSHLPIADLVQLLAMNGKTGCLRLRAHMQGRIHFREGRIVGAFSAQTKGRKALFRMLGWAEADFHFDPVDDPTVTEDLEANTQRLLMDALVELDDLRRISSELPQIHQKLVVTELAEELLVDPANLTPVELRLLDQAREGTTLGELQDRIDATDLDVARGVSNLLHAEALIVAGSELPKR